jgi:hypothetical protein
MSDAPEIFETEEEVMKRGYRIPPLVYERMDELESKLAAAEAERDRLRDVIDCACNALTDSINASGNDANTNRHWVSRLRKEAGLVADAAFDRVKGREG